LLKANANELGPHERAGPAAGRKRAVSSPLVAFGDPDTVGATPKKKLFDRAWRSRDFRYGPWPLSTRDAGRRGFALLIVVLTVAALALLATPFLVSMRLQERSSRNAVDRARARYAVTAAFNHALAQLLEAGREYGEFAVSFESLPAEFEWSGSDRGLMIAAEVFDEQGKINVNTAREYVLARLFADPEVGLGLTAEQAEQRADGIGTLRADEGRLPTLHSLVTGGVFSEGELALLRPHLTVHSEIERDAGFARVNFNTASTPVLRAVLAGARLRFVQPIRDPANTGDGAMSAVDTLPVIIFGDGDIVDHADLPSWSWEVRCTNVQTNSETGARTFTFTVETYPKDDPSTRTEWVTIEFAEEPDKLGFWSSLGTTDFLWMLCNGPIDFAVGDKFTFQTGRFSYVRETYDPTAVDGLLKRFRATLQMDAENETLIVDDASRFPDSGHVMIRGDVIRYASRDGNRLEGCTGIAGMPKSGETVALVVPDLAAFDARLREAVADGDLEERDRAAIVACAKNPNILTVLFDATGLCFGPSARYTVEAVGVVNDPAGNEVQRTRVRRAVALDRGQPGAWTIDSQEALDRAMAGRTAWSPLAHLVSRSKDLITRPGASFLFDVAPSADDDARVALAPLHEPGDGWTFRGPTLFGATNWSSPRLVYGPAAPGTAFTPGEDLYRDGQPGLFITGDTSFRCFAQPTGIDVDNDDTRSLIIWVRPSGFFNYGGEHIFFDTGPADSTEHRDRIRLSYAQGKLIFRIADSALEPRSAEVRATVGQSRFERNAWHRIEAVWSGMDIGRMALLLDGKLIGSYDPSGGEAEDTASPALADEKWIARVGNYLTQQGEPGGVRGTQPGTSSPKSVYGYGLCKFVNQDASTRKSEFNKVHRGGATLARPVGTNRVATLRGALSAAATVIQVPDATTLPKRGYVGIDGEIIKHTDWRLVEVKDSDDNVIETYYELVLGDGAAARGRDFGDNLATRFETEPTDHAAGADVACVSIEVSDNASYPMPQVLHVPREVVDYFGLSGLDPGTCVVQVDDEWISYTHRAETTFLVNVRAAFPQVDSVQPISMRGAGGTEPAAHSEDAPVRPVYQVTTGGRPGAGDRVTIRHDGLDPSDHKEAVIKHAVAGAATLVGFTGTIPGTHDLYIKKGSTARNAGFIKFPSGRYTPNRFVSIGGPVSGAGRRADATIGSVHLLEHDAGPAARIKESVNGSATGGFDLLIGSLDEFLEGGTPWAWNGEFGVDSWPLVGQIKIDDEAFVYKVRYPHNIAHDETRGAVSQSATTTVGGDAGVPATGNIVWTRQGVEADPVAAGFNPHGGYLVITSYSRTKADDSVRSLGSISQELLDWLIAEGHVTQEFVDAHGTQDPDTGVWTFEDITVEGSWVTSESREFVRYTRIEPAEPGAGQYTFHCDAAGRHLYDTHKGGGGTPLDHLPADDGEGGTLYPTLTARTVALTVLQRGAPSGARALGTARSDHPTGSRLMPMPSRPVAIITGPPVGEDLAAAQPTEGTRIPVENASHFPDLGYIEITDAAGVREIIYYTHKAESAIAGSNPPRKQQYLCGVRRFRGRFGTTPIDLSGLAAFDDLRDTSATQTAAYRDPQRIARLVRPWVHDRMPLAITVESGSETERVYAPHADDADLVFFEATKTARGARWLWVDWTEEVPDNTDVIVLARVGESPAWRTGVPVPWGDVDEDSGRVVWKFDAPKEQDGDNAIGAAGDTITIRVFFKFKPGYDLTTWDLPVLKSLSVGYQAGPRIIESEVLDY